MFRQVLVGASKGRGRISDTDMLDALVVHVLLRKARAVGGGEGALVRPGRHGEGEGNNGAVQRSRDEEQMRRRGRLNSVGRRREREEEGLIKRESGGPEEIGSDGRGQRPGLGTPPGDEPGVR